MTNQDFQAFVREVKDRSDLVQVISRYVSMKRSGARFMGICPFHNDHNPSMVVTPALGIYKCFVCGASGDVIAFIMEHEKISFMEALENLANDLGLKMPKTGSDKSEGMYQSLIELHQLAHAFYQKNLKQDKACSDYLASRGLSGETIQKFGLGYAPRGSQLLQALQRKAYPMPLLEKSGLIKKNYQNKWTDTFSNRLVFPILNMGSRVIGFGGRALESGQKPKYLNSPETTIYKKSQVLYGLSWSRSAIASQKECILVEGYMDVIALWQTGFKNTCATSGTAFGTDQALQIKRFADSVVFLLDGDRAGREAILRNLPEILKAGLEVKVPHLESTEDPDSLVAEHGPEELQKRIAQSDPLEKFLFAHLGTHWEELSPEKREIILKQGLQVFSHISSDFVRESYTRKWFSLLGIPYQDTGRLPNSQNKAQNPQKRAHLPHFQPQLRELSGPEWQLVKILIVSKELAFEAVNRLKLEWLGDLKAREVIDQLLAYIEDTGQWNPKDWVERLPHDQKNAAETLMGFVIESADVKKEFEDILGALEIKYVKNEMKLLAEKVQNGVLPASEGMAKHKQYQQKLVSLGQKG